MLIFLFIIFARSLEIFTGDDVGCYNVQISDGYCDKQCMMPIRNFDSSINSLDPIEVFKGSDCLNMCLKQGCTIEMLADPDCSEACNIIECGWGLGKCGFCASGCFMNMLTNSEPDLKCNEPNCKYDNGQFGWCAPECFKEDLLEGSVFKEECNVTSCSMQNGIGMPEECSPGCNYVYISYPVCWKYCDNPACQYAFGMCLCHPGCDLDQLATPGCDKDDPCNNQQCSWKNGKCPPMCSTDCYLNMINNGVCDNSCFNKECNWDGSDCSCAEGCPSKWDGSSWNHQGECLEACLVETCQLNYNSCNQKGILLNALLTRMNLYDSMMTNYNHCGCDNDKLLSFSESSTCAKTDPCYNLNCSYCLGYPKIDKKIDKCLRYHNGGCLIYEGGIMYRGLTIKESEKAIVESLKDVLETVDDLNNLIPGTTHYFLKAGGYLKRFHNISVVASNDSYSFGDALSDCIYPYCSINLGVGFFHFSPLKNVKNYMENEFEPLNFKLILYQKELHIKGSGKDTVVFFYEAMVFHSFYEMLFISDITFSGKYLVSPGCDKEACFYCPAYFDIGNGYFKDDRSRIVNDKTLVSICQGLYNDVPFEFNSITVINDVDFVDFRNNPTSLIQSTGSLTINSCNFSKIQCKESCISLECDKDCAEISLTLQDSVVTDLNPGYEHTDSVALGGFLKARKIGIVLLQNVTFEFSVAIRSTKYSKSSLLQFLNIQGQVQINECKFENIYTDYLLLVDSTNLEFEKFSVDKYWIRKEYSNVHLSVTDSQFLNIFTRTNLMKVIMGSNRLNIDVKRCTFQDIVAFGSGFFYFTSDSVLTQEENEGDYVIQLINNRREKFFYSPKSLNLEDIGFSNVKLTGNIVKVDFYPNVSLKQLTFNYVTKSSSNDIYTMVIANFKKSGKYLSLLPEESELASSDLKSLMHITNTFKLNQQAINFYDIKTDSTEFSILIIESSATVILEEITFNKIELNSGISCLINSKSLQAIALDSVYISSVVNEKGLMSFSDCKITIITNYYQEHTQNSYAASISIENPKILISENLTFLDCKSLDSRGGIFFISFIDSSEISINYIKLIKVVNLKGKAGFLYLDSGKSSSLMNLRVLNLNITESYSYLCFIIFSSNVNFNISEIFGLTLFKSSTEFSPIIVDEHQGSGILFHDIKAEKITQCSHFYYGKFNIDSLSVNIEKILLFDSQFLDSIVYIEMINDYAIFYGNEFQVVDCAAGFIFDLKFVHSLIINSKFNNFTGQAFKIENSIINNNNLTFNKVSMGALWSNKAVFICDNCVLNNSNSTFLTYSQNSAVNFTRSSFMNSVTVKHSILSCESSFLESFFTSCRFENSFSFNNSAFKLIGCNIKVTNSSFKGVRSNSVIISLDINSVGNFVSSQFLFNESKIFSVSGSYLFIYDCRFSGNREYLENLGLVFNYSKLDSNTELSKDLMKNESEYELIYCSFSYIKIFNTSFSYILGKKSSVIQSQSSFLSIEKVKIENFFTSGELSSAIFIESSSFQADYLNISNSFTYSSGIVLTSQSDYHLSEISNSILTNIHSINGGGLITVNPSSYSKVFFYSSVIENNTVTRSGGGIFAENSHLVINNTRILNNSAVTFGGGIFYSSVDCMTCQLLITNNSEIVNNSCAEGEGGGIKWDKKPKVFNSSIRANRAKHGNDYASYPSQLVLSSVSRFLLLNESSALILSPGQVYNDSIEVCMQDSYSNPYSQDSSSTAVLEKGSNQSISVLGTTEFKSIEGCFSMTGFKVMGTPGSFSSILVKTSAIDEENQLKSGDDQNYSSTLEIPVFLRDCLNGESKDSMSCTKCGFGQYLFEPEKNCKDCPSSGLCPGGDLLLPRSGYWKVSKYTETLYPCLLSAACLGSLNETDYSGSCEVGYQGHLCASCEIGYSLSSSGKCSKCPSQGLNILVLLALITGITGLCIILVRSTLKSAFSPQNIQSVYIKIFTNYLQIVFLTTQFNLNWPDIVLSLFSVQKTAATAPDQVFSVDCYMTGNNMDTELQYYTKVTLFACLPGGIFVLCLIFWFFVCLIKENYQSLKRELFTSIIVLFFLVHPNITKVFFSSFSCKNLETIDYWLNDNLEVKCYTKNHYKYLSILSGPSIIVWVLGFPAVLLVILLKKKRFLHLDTYKVIFGFLYNGYKSSKFYWEFIILYRKILIISIIIFMSSATVAIQALTVNFLLILSIYLQFKHHPFSAGSLNKLEMEALITATLTIYSGLYYLTDDLNEATKIVLFAVILLGNTYFLVFWIWYNLKVLTDVLVLLLPILKRACKKGDSLEIDYYEENIQTPGVFSGTQTDEKVYTLRQNFEKYLTEKMKGVNSMKALYIDYMKNNSLKHLSDNKISREENSFDQDFTDFV